MATKLIPIGLLRMQRMKKKNTSKVRKTEINGIANIIRKQIISDILCKTKTTKKQREQFIQVCDGDFDYLVDNYLDEIEEIVKNKMKERSYWRF